MRVTLHVWRQPGPQAAGAFERYEVPDASEHMSFLELLDVLNERLLARGEAPGIDSDCREGVCALRLHDRRLGTAAPAPHLCRCTARVRDGQAWLSPGSTPSRWCANLGWPLRLYRIIQAALRPVTPAAPVATPPVPKPNENPRFGPPPASDAARLNKTQCPNGTAQLFPRKVSHLARSAGAS